MNSKHVKIFVLIALTAVMVYLWWGNLLPSGPIQSISGRGSTGGRAVSTSAANADPMVYRPAKLNPFKRFDVASPPTTKSGPPQGTAKPHSVKLSSKMALAGFVAGAPRTQVVLQDQAGATVTKSLGDTIYDWKLIQVTSTMAIFAAGKQRDTLFLKK